MKKNTSKKLYNITFDEGHRWGETTFAKIVEEHTTDKNKIKDIVNQRLKYSYQTNQYIVHSVKIESHDLIDVEGRVFVSQDTKYLGEYTVLYPNQTLDQKYVAYAPDRNVIDLNLNLIQKANQR